MLAGLSPASNEDTLFWPLIGRGVGTALIFLPLSIATLGGIPRSEVPAASGLFSLTRQMGGSIGIAVLTTMLEKFSMIHRGELVQHITPLSVPFQQRSLMANFNLTPQTPNIQIASQKALGVFDNIVSLQASLLASVDIFQALSWMFLLTLPLIFLLSRGGVKPGGAH